MDTGVHRPSNLSSIPLFDSLSGERVVAEAYDQLIGAWPIEYQELTVPTSFGDTHVICGGPPDAPALVLLHALFATATSWYRNIEGLSQEYRTFCVDVVGEANRSRPTRPMVSLEDFLTWFTELIDGLGIGTVRLIGNSYGGFTAAYFAMRLPDRVEKLVLIGPAATISPMRPFISHMFVPKALYLLAPWLPGGSATARRSVDWMLAGLLPDPLWHPLFLETMAHGKLINRVFPRVYEKDELSAIRAPVLLLFGDHERIYGDLERAIRSAHDLMPWGKVALIREAHHIAALANPTAANHEITSFLAESCTK